MEEKETIKELINEMFEISNTDEKLNEEYERFKKGQEKLLKKIALGDDDELKDFMLETFDLAAVINLARYGKSRKKELNRVNKYAFKYSKTYLPFIFVLEEKKKEEE